MPVPQQKFREIVFLIQYSTDIGESTEEGLLPLVMKELAVTRKVVMQAHDRVKAIKEKQDEIDSLIKKTSESYDFSRIQTIERNVLRLGIYELLYDETIPPKVAIAEAIRLARKFGTPEASAFVNALLDQIYQASQGEEVKEEPLTKAFESLMKSEEVAHEASQQNPEISGEPPSK